MSICVQEQIFGLQISVCDTFALVEVFKDKDNFCGIEAGCVFIESFCFS